MYVAKIKPFVFPQVELFDFIAVDKCIHFQRIPEEYIAFFIVKGDMYLMEDDIAYHLEEGDWFLLEPGKEHHGYKISEHCTYFYIHFHMDEIQFSEEDEETLRTHLNKNKMEALQGKRLDGPILLPKWYHSQDHTAYDSTLHLLNQGRHYFNGYKEFFDIRTSCLLVDLFIHLSHLFTKQMLSHQEKSIKRSTFIVYRLLKELNNNYTRKFSSSMIERQFECNFDYLNRIFKKQTGQTIFAYLTKVRIAKAKMLLISGNLPIYTIACKVGYEDIYYFSNVFKKQTGYSPTQYRKMVLES